MRIKKGDIPWNKTNIMVSCDYCEKLFKIEPWRLKIHKKHYCSVSCAHKGMRVRSIVKCDYCGKLFNRTPWRLKNYKKHYCNQECADKDRINRYFNGLLPKNYDLKTYDKQRRLKKGKRERKVLIDRYIKTLLRASMTRNGIFFAITPEIVELKHQQLVMKRTLKQLKKRRKQHGSNYANIRGEQCQNEKNNRW